MFFLTKRKDFPRDSTAPERSELAECEGWVKKLSKKGVWQNRFFALNNGFLNYYSAASRAAQLAAINLSMVRMRRRHPCNALVTL
jgi:PH domain